MLDELTYAVWYIVLYERILLSLLVLYRYNILYTWYTMMA